MMMHEARCAAVVVLSLLGATSAAVPLNGIPDGVGLLRPFGSVDTCNALVDETLRDVTDRSQHPHLEPYKMQDIEYSLGPLGNGKVIITRGLIRGLTNVRRSGECAIMIHKESVQIRIPVRWEMLRFSADVEGNFEDDTYAFALRGTLAATEGMLAYAMDHSYANPRFTGLHVRRMRDVELDTPEKDIDASSLVKKIMATLVGHHWQANIADIIGKEIESLIREASKKLS